MSETNGRNWSRSRCAMWTLITVGVIAILGTTFWATRGDHDSVLEEAALVDAASANDDAPEDEFAIETIELDFTPVDADVPPTDH